MSCQNKDERDVIKLKIIYTTHDYDIAHEMSASHFTGLMELLA